MVSKTKQVLLAIAIAVIFAFFVGYGINTFYEEPRYDDFCEGYRFNTFETSQECEDAGGSWIEYPDEKIPMTNTMTCSKISETENNITLSCNAIQREDRNGWCEYTPRCQEEYNNSRENYNRNVFIISLIIGLIGLGIGAAFLTVESVGSGLMGGGVLTIIYGIIRYWGDASDTLRFILLGIVLAVLVGMGYTVLNPKKTKIFEKSKKKSKR